LKALCLAFSIFALIVPAAAGELSSSEDVASESIAQAGEAGANGLYRLEWLRHMSARDREAALSSESTDEAEFNAKLRAMLQLAKEEIRRAAASSEPVAIRVRVSCVEKRLMMARAPKQALVPALEWSPAELAPTTAVTSMVIKGCSLKLVRIRAKPKTANHNVPFAVELPVLEQTAQ